MDETLYAGSAPYYAVGRMPYPQEVADALRRELGLDGTGRLLDVGCGPGSLTRLLAPLFAATVGIDADAGMLAAAPAVPGVTWRRMRAEELPGDLGTFRVVTFAQSFHWMDRQRVAGLVRPMLEAGGAWVHVGAITHRGRVQAGAPPYDEIDALIARYLGPVRRAGQGLLPGGTLGGEEDVMRAAGYRGPARLVVGGDTAVERSTDEVVAAVFSLSNAAPHLFGERLADFERDLRALLGGGPFTEHTHPVELVIWS
ncbi:class I SAM-dependent methyltransferase [Phytohabitans rumicis]|uniref:Methyltransferase n=1 Tax=Phytohabitans rumicis TaxID=1076125 RepID=A0A6V8L1Z8_9ACTN|nr:class I SAM-dependent methyltransferase [Phytohabitans rumicis]GFJ88136.1 methyltransferase [Phytohabitans rumicis]